MTDVDNAPRHEQQSPRRYYGKYAGLVIDNGPSPSGGAHRGQLKVQVPGILEETPDGNGNRPIEVLAAPAFLPGFFFIPENRAPVWVEFVAGDINSPIWTGVWYPQDGAPKTADSAAPTEHQKVIRTASGQVIQLDDTDDGQKIVVKDEKNGSTVTLDKSGITIESAAGIILNYKPSSGTASTVTMDSSGIKASCGDSSSITIASDHIQLKSADVKVKVDHAMDVS